MKKKQKIFLQWPLLGLCFIAFSFNTWPGGPEWYGNDHFIITKTEEIIKVAMNKLPYESFSVKIEDLKSSDGTISFEIKSVDKISLRVDGFTSQGIQTTLFNEEVQAGSFEKLYYNLNESEHPVSQLIFFVNPGEKYKGEVLFKNFKVGTDLNYNKNISIYPNPALDVINIKLPDEDFESLAIFDLSGRLVLEKIVEKSLITVDLAGEKTGIYILKAKGLKSTLTQKFEVK